MPLSMSQRGAIGGRVRADSQTPEQRRELARKAYLAGAVNAVVARAPELSQEQTARLRAIFGQA